MADQLEQYRGSKVVIRFDGKRCIHSRHCVLDAPGVFMPNVEGPWINPDAAPPEAIYAIALACPSGAISFERLDGGPNEAAPAVNIARVRENGPIALHAEAAVAGGPTQYRMTLCRCGASQNKPYCDGSHTAAGFAATGEPAVQDSQPLAVRNGTLAVLPVPNGPLHVKGALEIVSGTGRTVNRTTETWLCRCGGSANKPYCDGSHKKLGFAG